ENDHINLKVAGQDGSVVQFKIKRHTPLSKLMKAYCERQVRRLAPPRGLPVCALLLCAPGIPRARVYIWTCLMATAFPFQGLSMRQIRFRFDGQPINETDTPAQLEMEDEDTIDVFQQQTGGAPESSLAGRGF
uniref:Small ubiquitin like modifier 3 n=1 Tax=Rhinopithecus bieti TaxID=61621 RepID=A0A2K6KX06_RHIBE